MKDLLSRLRTAAIVMDNLPEDPGYNGSRLLIDDIEAEEIATVINAAVSALETNYQCIGVIDADGYIYPGLPEPGTQIFTKTPNADVTG